MTFAVIRATVIVTSPAEKRGFLHYREAVQAEQRLFAMIKAESKILREAWQ